MNKKLRTKCESLDNSLNQLLLELSKCPQEILKENPAQGGWSVMEILQHLLIAEKTSLAYVKKKTSYPDSLTQAGIADQMRKLWLFLFLRMPMKVKAPAVVSEDHFDSTISYSELVNDWKKHRNELQAFLENVPNDWLNKLTYRHSFAGRMTFDGMLLFFRDHFVRHRKQIDRTLANVHSM